MFTNPFKRSKAKADANNTTEANYDVSDAFIAEAKPLWEQLHDLAKKYNIPVVVAACTMNEENRYSTSGCVHLVGPERTPIAFGLGTAFLHRGMEAGMSEVSKVAMLKVLGKIIGAEGDDDGDGDEAGGVEGKDARPTGATLQ